MESRIETATFDDRREAPRFDLAFRAVLIDTEVTGEQAEIVNIARLGFLARTPRVFETGAEITLTLPHIGPIRGTVVWCANGLLGARFHDPIDERSFDDFLASLT